MGKFYLTVMLTIFSLVVTGCSPGGKALTVDEKKQVANDMEQETLAKFYEAQPSLETKTAEYAGYGVFNNANVNIIFASAAGGYGVVVNNQTKEKTYMKMAMGGLGLGLGVKDYRVLLLFKDAEILNKFIDKGWEFGGNADAAVKAGDKGGQISGEGDIHEGIEVYALTESGLALQATVTGTKYWKDKELN